MDEGLLIEAKKYLPDPDFIVDLYDLTFIWASPRGLAMGGYDQTDVGKLRSIDVIAFDQKYSEQDFRKELSQRLGQRQGTMKLPVKIKGGATAMMELEYHIFSYKGGWYAADKILEMVKSQ